ncbi:MAG: hypothetical protein O9264_10635 [Leptospira sp.]|jgi:hypothetical protein|nr:hypothetical protein [Leptospira sp.]
MKNQIVNFKIENKIPTTFSVSKWNTLHLHARLKRHGDLSTYIDYLLDKYAIRIYRGYHLEIDTNQLRQKTKTEENLVIKCNISETTLQEFSDLAKYASIGRILLFRILFSWDLKGTEPYMKMVA